MLIFSRRGNLAAPWSASVALRSPCGLPRPTRSCSSGTTRRCRSGASSGGSSGRRSLTISSCSSRSTPSQTSRVCLLHPGLFPILRTHIRAARANAQDGRRRCSVKMWHSTNVVFSIVVWIVQQEAEAKRREDRLRADSAKGNEARARQEAMRRESGLSSSS